MTNPIDVPRVEYRNVCGKPCKFIVEGLQQHSVYLCTMDEVANVLRAVPPCDMEGLELFVFHQPKAEEPPGCCWGSYVAEYPDEGELRRAVVLNAVGDSPQLTAVRMADRISEHEIECLREDGHLAALIGGRYFITSTREAVRRTQLYRAVYHLVYHHMEAMRGMPEEAEGERERNANLYARQMKRKWLSEMLRYD